MPDATKYPPSTHGVRARGSENPKILWAESRVRGTGEYFPPLQSHGKIVEVEIGGITIYRPFGEFRRANSYCHLYKPIGTRNRGRPKLRWAGCVVKDFKVLVVTNWRTFARRRSEWKRVLHSGVTYTPATPAPRGGEGQDSRGL
ncbi:uncharacterized protein TNCV_4212811 [Trichonephila clavipes]|nr:uncharacterized protein TNCV_4212811 [Trichonephila clavipes]